MSANIWNFHSDLKQASMNFLVTAIGSFSAHCVISTLKSHNMRVVGCDIYPANWHFESTLCDTVYQAPLAKEEDNYVDFITDICRRESITYIIPLTDVEIDVFNKHRDIFGRLGITLCMPAADTLAIVRDKYRLFKEFESDAHIPSIPTYLATDSIPDNILPCIAKPVDGRSSEGLLRIHTAKDLNSVIGNPGYILQPMIDGAVYTVDYVRNAHTKSDFSVAREELLRTKNGAGTTVRVFNSDTLSRMVSHIGNTLNIHGCVNMEFIFNDGNYYLIDINPRFSAGIAFSNKAGYDMVTSHINVHMGKEQLPPVAIAENIMSKHYVEDILI